MQKLPNYKIMGKLGTDWEVMDFVDTVASFAFELSDNDIGSILVCIGAKNRLRRLKLTHCFDVNVIVIGDCCLGPLRSSTVLEKLDLELHRQFEQSDWNISTGGLLDNPKLSKLMCVTSYNLLWKENSLRCLQYPYKRYDGNGEII
jgi:hypothetical protein